MHPPGGSGLAQKFNPCFSIPDSCIACIRGPKLDAAFHVSKADLAELVTTGPTILAKKELKLTYTGNAIELTHARLRGKSTFVCILPRGAKFNICTLLHRILLQLLKEHPSFYLQFYQVLHRYGKSKGGTRYAMAR